MIKKEYDVEEDGIVYLVTEFADGSSIKVIKPDEDTPAPPDPTAGILSEKEQREMEMAMNLEYLVQLMEAQNTAAAGKESK